MMRRSLRHSLGLLGLGCAVVLGCNQSQRRAGLDGSRPVAVTMTPTYLLNQDQLNLPKREVIVAKPEPKPAPEEKAVETLPAPKDVMPVAFKDNDEPFKRRSYADITARPGFGHAPDYSWLTGELQYVHVRKAWRLRYASVDEEDRYGGSVTLTDMGPTDKLVSGQMIRVEGRLADPESKEPSPQYRVHSLQALTAQ